MDSDSSLFEAAIINFKYDVVFAYWSRKLDWSNESYSFHFLYILNHLV